MKCRKVDCPFHHITPNGMGPKRTLCNKFPNCKFGDKCHFSHVSPEMPREENVISLSNLPAGMIGG